MKIINKIIALTLIMLATAAHAQSSITAGFSRGNPSAKQVALQAINDAQESIIDGCVSIH